MLESIIREEIMEHLLSNKLMTNQQHGFMQNKACVTNQLETMDYITKQISDGNNVDIIYMDFAKAFDTVPHKRLIQKISAYGIKGKTLDWIRDFLSNRKQRVVMGESVSTWCEIFSGVPQGSVLGPLLFLLFINDLPDQVKCECKLYADDSKLMSLANNKDDKSRLQNDINNIIEWTNKWLVKLNKQKCKVMHIGYKNENYSYKISDGSEEYVLEETTAERDLGVIISSNLKCENQVNAAVAKAQKALGYIKRTFTYFDAEMVKNLYITFVRPHLEFAVPVWKPYQLVDIAKMEAIQRRATKLAPELKNLNYEARLQELGLTTLEKRRLRGDLIQQYKFHHNFDKINWFVPQVNAPAITSTGPAASIRGHKFRLEREIIHHCEQRYQFFTNRIVPYWNSLPRDIIEARSMNVSKAKLDLYL
jgi:hypothetical protein